MQLLPAKQVTEAVANCGCFEYLLLFLLDEIVGTKEEYILCANYELGLLIKTS